MWTGVSRFALGVTFIGGLAAVLLYLGQNHVVSQLGAAVPLLRLVAFLSLFLAIALLLLRQHAVERRLPQYETLTDVQEARLRAREEEIAHLKERLAEKEEERKRAGAMLMAFLKSADKQEPGDEP